MLYKQDNADAAPVRFGLKLTKLYQDADYRIENELAGLPIKSLPAADAGYTWTMAEFQIDTRGYDVSSEMPDIPFRVCDEHGKLLNGGRTFLIKQTDEKAVIFFESKTDESFQIKAGFQQSLTIQCERSMFD